MEKKKNGGKPLAATPKKSGKNWTARVYLGRDLAGKRVYESITAPTLIEWQYLYADFLRRKAAVAGEKEQKLEDGLTVGEAIEKYIEDSRDYLSPTTIEGYEKNLRNYFLELQTLLVKDLTKEIAQDAIRLESRRTSRGGRLLSPKTIKNAWGTVEAALREVCGVHFDVKLPKIARKLPEMPAVEDLIPLLVDSPVELPCMIAIWLSYSMSEIMGLNCSSVRNGRLYIDRVRVTVDNMEIEKPYAKNDTRTRANALPPYIMGLIEKLPNYRHYIATGEDSKLIPMKADKIRREFQKIMIAAGYPNFNFHKLRHENASVMALLNVPEKYAMERGGWKTPNTMKNVYQHTFSAARLAVDAQVDKFFEDILLAPSGAKETPLAAIDVGTHYLN